MRYFNSSGVVIRNRDFVGRGAFVVTPGRHRAWLKVGVCLVALLVGFACGPSESEKEAQLVGKEKFGTTPEGEAVDVYTLRNANGVEVRAINYGGIIVSLRVPDRDGRFDDIALGCDTLEGYLKGTPYFGAIVGRYGNRIAKGKFTLDGTEYTLAVNNGPNHLHGGIKGFDNIVWQGEAFDSEEGAGVRFSYTSPDGEEGYPGNLAMKITYTLTPQDDLIFDYHATTDIATPVNLTQHSYFNLAVDGKGDILGHELMLKAGHFTPVDETLIPTGEIRSVAGTKMDFTEPTAIGARIDQEDEQLYFGGGYDHNFVISREGEGLSLAARLYEPTTGRVMEVHTTEPGVQFYSGNFLDGTVTGKTGQPYERRTGLCLETQHYPDSPNQPDFPSCILRPGETYESRTVLKFSARPAE